MKKRILSVVMAAVLAVSLLPALSPAAGAVVLGSGSVGNVSWSVDVPAGGTTGTLTITRRTASGNVVIPNYTASSRPPWYAHSAQIDEIVIGDNITEIGNYAFANFGNLKKVTVGSNVSRIGNDAFRGCSNLDSFITLTPGSVTALGSSAFYNCESIPELYLPNVTSIGTEAFVGCQWLVIFNIGNDAANGRIKTVNGVVVEINSAGQIIRIIKSSVDLSGNYTIPQTFGAAPLSATPAAIVIEVEAFAYCTGLTGVTLPANVTTIRDRAFAYDSNLIKATFFGDAPTTFGTNVFNGSMDSFVIVFYPHGQRWTTPRWQGYRTEINYSRIELDRYIIVMEKGATELLRATVQPASANQAVVWESDNENIAKIAGAGGVNDNLGIITAIGTGTAVITAQALNDKSAFVECTIIVLDRGTSSSIVLLDQARIQAVMSPVDQDPPPLPIYLTAVVYPYPEDLAERQKIASDLVWSSSNQSVAVISTATSTSLAREIILRSPGTTTITVRTPDGKSSASCIVTVTAAPVFIPVTDVTLDTATFARGTIIDLNKISKVYPSNATNNPFIPGNEGTGILWEILPAQTASEGITIPDGEFSVPWDKTGTMYIRASVERGRADRDWGYNQDLPYTKVFAINIVQFIPVTGITDVPTLAFAGVPLQLKGTVLPVGASYRTIEWSLGSINTTGATVILDQATGVLTAQRPGTVSVVATVRNALMSETEGLGFAPQEIYSTFTIRVDPYIANALELRANPGGTVSGAGAGQFAGGEVITINAVPNAGYMFAGWFSSNGGEFADASRATTQFTMPGNATAVTAFFTYIGLPGGDAGTAGNWTGGVILPTPVHYFTNNSIYTKNSGVTFGHVTVRDFQLFSYVTLDGKTLSRNAHYTASRNGGYTEIILANGYLNALEQGAHTLIVYFTDYVSVTAVFTVIATAQASNDYDDVYTSDWYYSCVSYVSERGWMTARPSEPRRFRPSDTVTQGEVIDALYRMAGSPAVMNMYGQPLQGRDAAYEWVRSNGILPLGGSYNLNSSITRQDIAVIFSKLVTVLRMRYTVVRAAQSFADDWQIDANARGAVNDIYRAGIMSGRTANTFVPLGNVTRAEYAAILQRFSEAMGI